MAGLGLIGALGGFAGGVVDQLKNQQRMGLEKQKLGMEGQKIGIEKQYADTAALNAVLNQSKTLAEAGNLEGAASTYNQFAKTKNLPTVEAWHPTSSGYEFFTADGKLIKANKQTGQYEVNDLEGANWKYTNVKDENGNDIPVRYDLKSGNFERMSEGGKPYAPTPSKKRQAEDSAAEIKLGMMSGDTDITPEAAAAAGVKLPAQKDQKGMRVSDVATAIRTIKSKYGKGGEDIVNPDGTINVNAFLKNKTSDYEEIIKKVGDDKDPLHGEAMDDLQKLRGYYTMMDKMIQQGSEQEQAKPGRKPLKIEGKGKVNYTQTATDKTGKKVGYNPQTKAWEEIKGE